MVREEGNRSSTFNLPTSSRTPGCSDLLTQCIHQQRSFPHTPFFTEVVTLCCLVHFFIVTASIAQPDGTAPMAEFADVFDLGGDPQKAMVGMMQVSGE